MTGAITLVLRSTDEARNAWRRGACRWCAGLLRRIGEHRAADALLAHAVRLSSAVPDASDEFEPTVVVEVEP